MRGGYDSVYDACFSAHTFRRMLIGWGKTLSNDSGQSIYLALATSLAKPQPFERPHRASWVTIYTKYWQRASYSYRFTLQTLLLQ